MTSPSRGTTNYDAIVIGSGPGGSACATLLQKRGVKTLLVEKSEGVATLTLNRPERHNAITLTMARELRAFWEAVKVDPEVVCIIVTGAGEKAFAPGNDIAEFEVEPRSDTALPAPRVGALGEAARSLAVPRTGGVDRHPAARQVQVAGPAPMRASMAASTRSVLVSWPMASAKRRAWRRRYRWADPARRCRQANRRRATRRSRRQKLSLSFSIP